MDSVWSEPLILNETGLSELRDALLHPPAGPDPAAFFAMLGAALARLHTLFGNALSGAVAFGAGLHEGASERSMDILLILHEPDMPEGYSDLRLAADEMLGQVGSRFGFPVRSMVYARKDLDRLKDSAPAMYYAACEGIVLCGDGLRRRP